MTMPAVAERIERLAEQWERDDAEHLARFGQHLPVSLASVAEMLRAALTPPP